MATGYKLRDEFEEWVHDQRRLVRKTKPGYTEEYEDPWTSGAWSAWRECHERAKPDPPDELHITREAWEDAIRGLGTKA